jgi:hypothetical protein
MKETPTEVSGSFSFYYLWNMIRSLSTLFICILLSTTCWSQFTKSYGYLKKTRDTVLMNTDHFYFGVEIGLGFNVGPTQTMAGGPRMETNDAPFSFYDFSMVTPSKGFVGYAYKSHHFEGSIGLVREHLNFSIQDSLGNRMIDHNRSKTYATMTVRYFFRFPLKVPRMKFMMGAEIGGAYHPKFLPSQPHSTVNDTSYTLALSTLTPHDFQLVLGLSGRIDIKLAKNLTFTLVGTLIGSPMRGTEYAINYSYPGIVNQTAQVNATILNVNLNAGLKLDFFSHANKKKTYEKYGIGDPFRDDQ